MNLKLRRIVIIYQDATDTVFTAAEVAEHDELTNGILIKGTNGTVYKYIGMPYVIVREPA